MESGTPKYKRVLLKLSGEALSGDKGSGLDIPTIENICKSIKKCADAGRSDWHSCRRAEIFGAEEAPRVWTERVQTISACSPLP